MNFLITGLPRSGTAWLANWFTTDHSICWHEALMDYSLEELLSFKSESLFGVSETFLCLLKPEEVNAIPVKKLVVHRPIEEVNASLEAAGLPGLMTEEHADNLRAIDGAHIDFKDIFDGDKFRIVHDWLVPLRFNTDRYALLRKLSVENKDAVDRCLEMVP